MFEPDDRKWALVYGALAIYLILSGCHKQSTLPPPPPPPVEEVETLPNTAGFVVDKQLIDKTTCRPDGEPETYLSSDQIIHLKYYCLQNGLKAEFYGSGGGAAYICGQCK